MRETKEGKRYTVRIARCWKVEGQWVCNRKFSGWMGTLGEENPELYDVVLKCFEHFYTLVNPDTARLTLAFATPADTDNWHVGWSACDPSDQYSRKFGNALALSRCLWSLEDTSACRWIAEEGGVPLYLISETAEDFFNPPKPKTALQRFLQFIGFGASATT